MDTEIIEKEFDKELIKTRKGRSGNKLSYVETPEYIRRLNRAFDYGWSFEIEDERIENEFIIVRGKLTAEGVAKVQYGTSQITTAKETGEVISIGDDFKSAGSDCLKKCCSLFGIGLHLYGGANGKSKDNGGMNRPTGNKGNGNVTKAQLSKIKSLRTKAGMSSDDVLDLTERMFSTRDPMTLNKEMGSAVIAVLENKVNGNSDETGEVV